MITTPYQIQLEDLPITVEYLNIVMPHFVEPLADFSEGVTPNMAIEGRWHKAGMRNAADFTVRLNFWGNDPAKQYSNLAFTGRFSINKHGGFEPPYLAERIGKYCYGLIENYVKQIPIIDKDKNLYPVPEFIFFEAAWPKLYFELP